MLRQSNVTVCISMTHITIKTVQRDSIRSGRLVIDDVRVPEGDIGLYSVVGL